MMKLFSRAATIASFSALPRRPGYAAGEQRFRELYKELVGDEHTLSAGNCTLAAERMTRD